MAALAFSIIIDYIYSKMDCLSTRESGRKNGGAAGGDNNKPGRGQKYVRRMTVLTRRGGGTRRVTRYPYRPPRKLYTIPEKDEELYERNEKSRLHNEAKRIGETNYFNKMCRFLCVYRKKST